MVGWALGLVWAALAASAEPAVSLQACIDAALHDNAELGGSRANVHDMEARLAAVRSTFWPKLEGLALLAPMYTVRGDGYSKQYTVRFKSLHDWGPYASLDMKLIQPLSTFGRAHAGIAAARAQLGAERAAYATARNALTLEVRKLYYAHLFARSMQPTLRRAIATLGQARTQASALFAKGSGEVTQVDLAKLAYGNSEALRQLRSAEDGATLALQALAHLMGRAAEPLLQLQEESMPQVTAVAPLSPFAGAARPPQQLSLIMLQRTAELRRPEWQQLREGRRAARAWEQAEHRATRPVLFLAGQLRYGYAPTRSIDRNPWHVDNYNTAVGGVALGLKFDLDPALAHAKEASAAATGERLAALARKAQTGIALQVRKAHADLLRAEQGAVLAAEGLQATRQWMSSAASAYHSGSGEARDLLEGLAAYVQAKKAHLETLRSFHLAASELRWAVGETQ